MPARPARVALPVLQTRTVTSRLGFPLLAYAFAAIMLGTTLPTPIYALYAHELHFAVLTTTVIFSAYAIGVLAALRWSQAGYDVDAVAEAARLGLLDPP